MKTPYRKTTGATSPLSEEDVHLIQEARFERERLKREEKILKERIAIIAKQKKQLSVNSLAKKFECKPYHIYSAMGDA